MAVKNQAAPEGTQSTECDAGVEPGRTFCRFLQTAGERGAVAAVRR